MSRYYFTTLRNIALNRCNKYFEEVAADKTILPNLRPQLREALSDQSSQSFLNLESRSRSDPVLFVNRILGVPTHAGQNKYLREAIKKKHYILCPSNQWGKSVIVACIHIWANYYKYKLPGWEIPRGSHATTNAMKKQLEVVSYQTLNISPRLRQAKLVYQYILDILQSRFTWQDVKRAGAIYSIKHWQTNKCLVENFLVSPRRVPNNTNLSSVPIQFAKNAQLWIASTGQDKGAGIAGSQYALITYDECGLSNYLEEELGNYIWSRLVKYDGSLHLISTPDADSDSYEYYRSLVERAQENPDTWGYQMGTITENRFLDPVKLKNQEKEMQEFDNTMYLQVFRGEFVGSKSRFFTPSEVERIFDKEQSFLEAQPHHKYVIGADFAVAQNYTVYITVDVTDENIWNIVKFIRFKGERYSPQMQLAMLADNAREYNNAEVSIDSSSLAGPFIEYSQELDRLDIYGNKFDSYSKKQLLVALKKTLGYNGVGRLRAPLPTAENGLFPLKRELHSYREKDKGKVKDCVMALGLVMWRMEESVQGGELKPFTLDPLAFMT